MFSSILSQLENTLTILGSAGAIYSGWSWFMARRRNRILDQPVTIRLVSIVDGRELFVLPYSPARRTLTRAELLGLLGMIPSGQKRYDWKSLIEPQFFQSIEDTLQGKCATIDISLSEEEFRQLDLQPSPEPPRPSL